MTLAVRAVAAPLALAPPIERKLRELDPDQPVASIQTMEQVVSNSVAQRRFNMLLIGIFAAVALGLAAVGVYGVMSYAVSERTQEIGIRMALGAMPADVLNLVLKDGLMLTLAGVAAGVVAALAATRVLAGSLYNVSASDPMTFLLAALFLCSITLSACSFPALRASAVDPMVVLRANLNAGRDALPWRSVLPTLFWGARLRRQWSAVHQDAGLVMELALAARNVSNVADLLHAIVEKTASTLGAGSAAVFVRREAGEFRCEAFSGATNGEGVSLAGEAFVVRRLRRLSVAMTVGEKDFRSWRTGLLSAPEPYRENREREIAALESVRAAVLVPIALKDQLIGILALGRRSQGSYDRDDLRVLTAVAGPLSFVIQNAQFVERVAEQERLRREIVLATEVQRRLFPEREPHSSALEIVGYCLPARDVGGDHYDFLEMEDGRIGLSLTDVAGKGIAAALLVSIVQASVRSLSPDRRGQLGDLVGRLNTLLHRSTGPSSYATFFYAEVDPGQKRLTYVNAGHNPPLLFRSKGTTEVIPLTTGGPVIGLFGSLPYEEETLQLETGDVLVAYTDGVTEALSMEGEEWGEERLKQAVWSCYSGAASQIREHLKNAVSQWMQGAPQHDDLTFFVMKVR